MDLNFERRTGTEMRNSIWDKENSMTDGGEGGMSKQGSGN